jgi:hypothetical protein
VFHQSSFGVDGYKKPPIHGCKTQLPLKNNSPKIIRI